MASRCQLAEDYHLLTFNKEAQLFKKFTRFYGIGFIIVTTVLAIGAYLEST